MIRPTKEPSPLEQPSVATHRIFIIDEHGLMREGLRLLLEVEADISVCGEAAELKSALSLMKEQRPDLILIDISLPGVDGLELIKNLAALYPGLPLLVLSRHDESLYAERALRAGARGYVMKQCSSEHLREAIRTVLHGGVYLSAALSSRLLQSMVKRKESFGDILTQLSDREFEILRLIGDGYTTREVASSLGISSKTVESHRGNMRQKLKLRNGAELFRFALSHKDEPMMARVS